jgi:putative membrane protein
MWCDWSTMGFFGWSMMIVFWGAVVFLVSWAIRALGASRSDTTSSALEVLQRRYAAGEIDRDEFEERRRLLEESMGKTR